MSVLTGVMVDPRTGAEVVRFEPKLEWYYKNLDCQYIDIAERQIDGMYYDFIVDDEGLLKDDSLPSCCDANGHTQLVGKVLICHHDGEGNETGLTEEEANKILEHRAFANFREQTIHLIADVEY